MKVVIDTNVLMSGLFFRGVPEQILQLWHKEKITIVISKEILEEYIRVASELKRSYPEIDLKNILDFITAKSELSIPKKLSQQVCEDPDDDKFLECAVKSKATYIISGDKHLLKLDGYKGIKVRKPRDFIEECF